MSFDSLAAHARKPPPPTPSQNGETRSSELQSIPGPPAWPIIGNLAEVDTSFPLGSFIRLAETYGPIFKFSAAGIDRVIISSHELVNEVCDESRFSKAVGGPLEQVRNGVKDGLFTAYPGEHNWGVAHRILVPAFGPLSIRGMFDEMHDIASQLVMKWARHGEGFVIPVTDDFTRLTLDTLALCAMDYRFNSFYRDDSMHPFVDAMGAFLYESGSRANRPGFMQSFYKKAEVKYRADIDLLRKTSDDVVKYRMEHPSDRKDLLNAMIKGRDPRTGEGLSQDSITNNMITFLIAGHETTSGLLSFVFYFLLKNPETYQKAQKEVDDVIGDGPITVELLNKLSYINAVLRETLRLESTAPGFSLQPLKDEVIGGKYSVHKGQTIICLLPKMHLDPAVWGEDAAAFKPERMLDEKFEKLPPNCWKPFGNGMRACIGRPFAWQEAQLVVALLLQNFNFVMEDPFYSLKIKQTLTIKPQGFHMRAILRKGLTPTKLERALRSEGATNATATVPPGPTGKVAASEGKPLAIYYGSNTGTCEAFAQRIASDAVLHGFRVTALDVLDAAKEKLPKDQPVFIVTASYEGQPTDNAALFVKWLEDLQGNEMDGVQYSVFGCGHHDWAATFHKIPTLIDRVLEERGGKRIAAKGSADAGGGDMFSEFETWEEKVFWPAMQKEYGGTSVLGAAVDSTVDVEVSTQVRSLKLRQDVREAQVVEERQLTDMPAKKHIEIQLPTGMTYRAGDYLAILPLNPEENVQKALRHFGLPHDAMLTIKATTTRTTLPTDSPIPAHDVFSAYVEIQQPATRRNIQALVDATGDQKTKDELTRLAGDAFVEEITSRRISLLDLLLRFPEVKLPLGPYLAMLPPMRVRQYSISSSPLWNPEHVTLTYAILDQPALSGEGRHIGVASNYLSHLKAGDRLHVSVRSSNQAFHLPTDAANTPIIMIAAGTGLAPFRGFIQERAAQLSAGRKLAPAMLFFGVRSPEQEFYHDELAAWEEAGAVTVRRAYSRKPEASNNCKYVQDRLWADRDEVQKLWDSNARVFICGSKELGEGVKEKILDIIMERQEQLGKGRDRERATKWYDEMRNDRFATDVFA